MNKISIAAELLNERASRTTDATAFAIKVEKDQEGNDKRIIITEDEERRGVPDGTFYHMEDVVDICRPLKLSYWITTRVEDGTATFEVNIY